jgi:hypothetical protein
MVAIRCFFFLFHTASSILSSLFFMTMVSLPVRTPGRTRRGPCALSVGERDCILPFKAQYKGCTNADQRKNVFMLHIGPAIFEYWRINKMEPKNSEESTLRSHMLSQWLNNNWHPTTTKIRNKVTTKGISYLNVIFRKHTDKMVELAESLCPAEGKVEWNGEPFFGKRNTIGKMVYERMTEAEKRLVDEEVKKSQIEGWEPEIQRT